MDKNFLNLFKTINPQIQEAQQKQCRRNMKKTTQGHIIIKLLKISIKEKVIRAARRKKIHLVK